MPSENLQAFLAELSPQLAGEVRVDDYSRVLYSTDASIYQIKPLGVVLPRTMEDVAATVEAAARYKIPLLPRGAGSSLAGQTVGEAIVIDMSRHLSQILEVNPEERWARAQPGVVLDHLNLHLKPYGLQFGPDPASGNRASLGGIVGNNSTGAHSILYGMTADHLLAVKALLSDGTAVACGPLDEAALQNKLRLPGLEGDIYRAVRRVVDENRAAIQARTPQTWRRCGGYNLDRFVDARPFNLAGLICGSEGTLATVTEVRLNLVPRPPMTALVIVQFDAMQAALEATPLILECEPSAVELMDEMGLSLCRGVPEYARRLTFLQGQPECILVTEFYGEGEAELRAKMDRLERHLRRRKAGTAYVRAVTPAQQADVWGVRKAGLGLLMGIKGDFKPIPFIEDTAVPVEHLAGYIGRVEGLMRELNTRAAYYAHASAGCLHIRPLINLKTEDGLLKMKTIAEATCDLVLEYGGAFSSEHGDGLARSWLNERVFGPAVYRAFCQVKAAFDPYNLMNPGKVVDAPPMTGHLRYGPDYAGRLVPLAEHLDFSADRGFARAVEMCNGAGVCRKTLDGTMCPSYMVTREEEHSTRGRANALRAAMSGFLPQSELTSRRMYQVLDLCLECKACKSECPSAVDMARIKFEFLVHYYQTHPPDLRTRLLAGIPTLNRLGSGPLAPLANAVLGSRPARRVLDRVLGLDARRSLPALARQPFTTWFARRRAVAERQVVLFNDTWLTYNQPEVGVAAVEVLEAAGFQVMLPGHRCCGRPYISKGFVKQARQAARATLDRLAPLAGQGLPIVVCEPSCASALRDDYLYLSDDPRRELVAGHCFTFEEFIAGLADEGALNLSFSGEARHLLLHGHCHQKALVGTGPARRALTLPPNYTVEEVDSGCCGLAGAFGYEREHYDLSLAMAGRRLLPAVRAAGAETIVVAAGTSCRAQIEHGAGRRALHPAQVLREALAAG
ncbi:MAG: FAD-binding and (Fe-S)-binding domain-containing protein [Anaerolineae bacterium]